MEFNQRNRASSILSFEFTSITHIMVLDKPDITWDVSIMVRLFELKQRYQEETTIRRPCLT